MELRTEIEIEAPARLVWSVLTDFSAYPEWNPFIARIEGELRAGAQLDVVLTPPNSRDFNVKPTIVNLAPEEELRWLGHLWFKGLFDGEHFFRVISVDPERTRFVHGENFTGILVKPLTSLLTNTARGFVFMNQALKRRVERHAS